MARREGEKKWRTNKKKFIEEGKYEKMYEREYERININWRSIYKSGRTFNRKLRR